MITNKPQGNSNWWMPAIEIFLRFSAWIVIPVIISAFLGRWLDKKFSTEPWLLLLSVGFFFIISMVGLTREALKEYKKIENKNSVQEKSLK